jgi:protein-S-isoprenylcysteine O-methyltransferase Ste14
MNLSPIVIVQIVIFIACSAALIAVSRKPLRDPRSHGFYRFFAWEAILALAALNLPVWFRDPFSLAHMVSWLLLIAAAFLVIHGVVLLRAVGKPKQTAERAGQSNYAFENTSQLVQVGAYRFIRHPLYASLFYLAWGVYLKQPAALLGLGLALAASLFLWLTARTDEEECQRFFGKEYLEYMRRTRMFIPFVF